MSSKMTFIYTGRSMASTFQPGDRLFAVHAGITDIRPGDIVVFKCLNHTGKTRDVVHRVIAVSKDGLITRGDNNSRPDNQCVTSEIFSGLVTHYERDGIKREVLGGRAGIFKADSIRALQPCKRAFLSLARGPYRLLKKHSPFPRFYSPKFSKITLATKHGPLIKYVSGEKTIAWHMPEKGFIKYRKPYDLFFRIDGG
jgi:signal peptidase I